MIIDEIREEVEELLEELECEDFRESTREQTRALRQRFNAHVAHFHYSDDFLVISEAHIGVWKYYMGFEYIDDSEVHHLGGYYIYHRDTDRVEGILTLLFENEE